MMTAAPTEILSTGGVRTLEVRWIFPGELASAVSGWFARFPVKTTVLKDAYLLDPHLPGLSVKVRGARALEVKVYRGSPGLLEVAGRARGRLESWQKWSFPHGPADLDGRNSAGWSQVSKRRRISRFSLAGRLVRASDRGLGEEPSCAVELTDVHARGEACWTLGFEATGPTNVLRSELEAAAALVLAVPLPGGLELGVDDSRSYAQWLYQRPQALGLSREPEGDPLAEFARDSFHIRDGQSCGR